MADNIELPSGSGGAVVATDDDGTAHHQYVKLEFGADNTQTKVSSANPLPVISASNSGVDIGDVTINNGTGSQSVPVQGAAATDAAVAGNPVLIGGEFDDTTPNSVDEGDVGSFRMSANRNLYVTLRDAAGNERGLNVDANGAIAITDGSGSITVDNAGLTELAAAINASSQMDVNIAASNASVAVTNAGITTIAGAVDGTEVQVDVVTSALPTGAATESKQDTAITALQLIDDAIYVDDADWTDGTSKHALVGGLYQSTPQTVTDGDVAPFNITANGALHVAQQGTVVVDLGANNDVTVTGTVDLGAVDNAVLDAIQAATEATQAALETAGGLVVNLGANNDVTVTGTVDLGATDNGVLDAIAASLALLDNAIPSGNELQVDVVAALPAGTNNIGDVDIASIAAGTNSIGNVGLVPRTSGGMTIFRSIDIDESEEEVKATAGQLFSITAFNTTAAPLYLKFYNLTAANTTVGTSTPVLTFVVPGNADSDGAGFIWNNEIGFAFSTAISVACTTGVADNDTGAPGANACIINLGYA